MCQRYSEAELDLRSGLAEKSLDIAQECIEAWMSPASEAAEDLIQTAART